VFFASFTDLSVGVQTAASTPFVSVLQEIFTGEGADLKVRVPPFEETHEGAQIFGRNTIQELIVQTNRISMKIFKILIVQTMSNTLIRVYIQ